MKSDVNVASWYGRLPHLSSITVTCPTADQEQVSSHNKTFHPIVLWACTWVLIIMMWGMWYWARDGQSLIRK